MSSKSSNRLSTVVSGAIVALAIGAVVFLVLQIRFTIPLDRSAIGFDGLARLLQDEAYEARTFTGGDELEVDGLGLRIVPVYQEGLASAFLSGRSEEAYLEPPARSIPLYVIIAKAEAAPTLVIMPKWSDGIRRSALAHPDFLLNHPDRFPAPEENADAAPDPEEDADAEPDETPADTETPDGSEADATREYELGESRVTLNDDLDELTKEEDETGPEFVLPELYLERTDTLQVETISARFFGDVSLRAPQFMQLPETCEPLIGDRDAAVLARCHFGTEKIDYWVLSDPDILNNHGLHAGSNAAAALAIVDELAGGEEIVIDYTTRLWSRPVEDRRTLDELLRFVAPPFVWLWLAAGLVFLLAWWRGFVRDRPVFSLFDHGHRGARETVVVAQSRLMRNTGRDGALLRVLAQQRALALCDLLLGRDDRSSNRQARMLAFVARRNRDLAERLTAAFQEAEAAPEHLNTGAAVALLTRLETAYEEARQLA
jgi:hypothetical protein